MILHDFIETLWTGSAHNAPASETWKETVARISQPGRNEQVARDVYWHYLESEPPFYIGDHGFIAACEGTDPVRLFSHRGGKYICRCLAREEVTTFCRLAGIELPDFFNLRRE